MIAKQFATVLLTIAFVGCAENPADSVPKVRAEPPKTISTASSATSGDTAAPAPSPATVPGSDLIFTQDGSKVDFVGSKVTGRHSGGFKAFSGTVDLSSDAKSIEKLTAEIEMTSTWSDSDSLTGHLKGADFFDVAKFPKTTFVTTEIKPGGDNGATHTITGNLELHGVNKSITFGANVAVTPESATLKSEFSLNRNDFGIVYPGKADDLIRNEVVLKLDIKASKPKS